MSLLDWVTATSKVVAGVAGGAGLYAGIKGWWRSGPGRRRYWGTAYRLLGCGVQLAYVESLFGIAAFKRSSDEERATYVWVLGNDGYLKVITEKDTVISYSLTTRHPRFKPRVLFGWVGTQDAEHTIRLGVTTFAEGSAPYQPEGIALRRGARRVQYAELYYTGNPGGYLYWTLASSDAGAPAAWASEHFHAFSDAFGVADVAAGHPSGWLGLDHDELVQALGNFRPSAVVNTVTVCELRGPDFPEPDFGADADSVRLIAFPPGRWARIRARLPWKRGRTPFEELPTSSTS